MTRATTTLTRAAGKAGGISLAYSEEKSNSLKLANLQTSNAQQQKLGVQEKQASSDQRKRLASQQADLAKADQDASDACAKPNIVVQRVAPLACRQIAAAAATFNDSSPPG